MTSDFPALPVEAGGYFLKGTSQSCMFIRVPPIRLPWRRVSLRINLHSDSFSVNNKAVTLLIAATCSCLPACHRAGGLGRLGVQHVSSPPPFLWNNCLLELQAEPIKQLEEHMAAACEPLRGPPQDAKFVVTVSETAPGFLRHRLFTEISELYTREPSRNPTPTTESAPPDHPLNFLTNL
ncbi:hypothetical protein Baya_16391 [Bagarius yarrelli]|uniref:Uncharacterized protein n=1 Tax=Bagarius yarrelli TaxID=175774 RepID=A0A556VV78_BAGYA|nr:hypothetical protein Baya_16391 [Bagarius yarrelli]